jgi:methylmalonyl-CoA/ethylmalonyl-CoA epimerase
MSRQYSLSLHHVGFATRDLQVATEAYVARFGYEIVSSVIYDPLQTAFVQFLRLAGDKSFLEFVAPDGPESTLMKAVERGGGLNHLCYDVDAMETAIDSLREEGMVLASPPKPAIAFPGRRVCWLLSRDRSLVELVDRGQPGEL